MNKYRIKPVEDNCVVESEFAYIDGKDYGLTTTWTTGTFEAWMTDSAAAELEEQPSIADLAYLCQEGNAHAEFEIRELYGLENENFSIDGVAVEHHNKALRRGEDYDTAISIECPVTLEKLS